MRTLLGTLLAAAMLVVGCTGSAEPPLDVPAPVNNPSNDPAPAKAVTVPSQSEVCLKPEDTTGIDIRLYKPQGDSTFSANPGWAIARPAFNLMGSVVFPQSVDRASVKVTVEPAADWQAVPMTSPIAPGTIVDFNYLPAGGNANDPLMAQWGKPGWITLTIASAKAQDGTDLVKEPVTLKIFAYDNEMAAQHQYLGECYTSLSVAPSGNDH